MRYIIAYQSFNESSGIADSVEKSSYEIWANIQNEIENMKDGTFTFSISESDFKVKDLKIDWTFLRSDERTCKGVLDLNKSKIEDRFLINSSISLDIKIDKIDDEFIYYVESVLFHELLHAFQHYNILLNDKFRPECWSIGSILPQLRGIIKTDYCKYIIDILYHSLSHELSAQLHQYYLYKTKHKDYIKLNDIKKLLYSFIVKSNLNKEEDKELNLIKRHILASIKYHVINKKYKKNTSKSLWNEVDNNIFLKKLHDLTRERIKWIDKKIKLIDSRFNKTITYNETICLSTNWDDHDRNDRWEYYNFIKENLNDCEVVDGI